MYARRRRHQTLFALVMLFIATATNATDYYKLENVKRVDQDLYRANNLYIETKYCYHYTYGETAVLNCFIFLFLSTTGAGPFSLDAMLFRKRAPNP